MRLYIVSTYLWKIWWPTWCHTFNVTHRNDFVTQKVIKHRSYSVWTRAWTRHVVDTLRGNMSVEPKHRKLWDKLYTDTSSHEKNLHADTSMYVKKLRRGTFFTVNTHHSPSRGSNQLSLTWFCMWKLHTYTFSYVKIFTWRRPHKSK